MKKVLSLVAVLAMVVTLVSVAAFSASAASTKVYKFTFEDENATSILKKGGVYVGEVVEWPAGSGNHCLRYELNAETQTGAGGAHPYIWPVGIGGVLAAQGDLEDTGSEFELNIDFAYAGSTKGSYMYPFILFNDEEENYADHSTYAPGSNEFNTGTFNWSAYEVGAPVNGLGNGGICFCDENTLAQGAYMYVDNIEFTWIGEWTDVPNTFIGYENGTPCEESDLDIGTLETDPVVTDPTEPSGTGSDDGVVGDATGDGVVNMKDVLAARKYVAGLSTDLDLVAADTNGDGKVNMKDVLNIRKIVAGMPI